MFNSGKLQASLKTLPISMLSDQHNIYSFCMFILCELNGTAAW